MWDQLEFLFADIISSKSHCCLLSFSPARFSKKSTEQMKKVPTIVLSVSYKGVKFIDATNKVTHRCAPSVMALVRLLAGLREKTREGAARSVLAAARLDLK